MTVDFYKQEKDNCYIMKWAKYGQMSEDLLSPLNGVLSYLHASFLCCQLPVLLFSLKL